MEEFVTDYYKQVFRTIDEDGDGKISSSELQTCLEKVGITLPNEDVKSLLEFDEDGLLDMEEFAKLFKMEESEAEKVKELTEAFGLIDLKGEGFITAESLRTMLGKMGTDKNTDECNEMIKKFDLNGDGVLSFDEFKAMMS